MSATQREIKFKACDGKKVYKAFNLNDVLHEKVEPIELWGDDIFFLEFTGLKDKHGMEIYEGDIIRETWEEFEPRESIFPVIFDSDIARFVVYNAYQSAVEVLGNIYENPELVDANHASTSAVTGEQ